MHFNCREAFARYLYDMDLRKEPYTVVSERFEPGRYYIAVIRRGDGKHPFLGEADIPSAPLHLIHAYQQNKEKVAKNEGENYAEQY